jgi:hypothetical protein
MIIIIHKVICCECLSAFRMETKNSLYASLSGLSANPCAFIPHVYVATNHNWLSSMFQWYLSLVILILIVFCVSHTNFLSKVVNDCESYVSLCQFIVWCFSVWLCLTSILYHKLIKSRILCHESCCECELWAVQIRIAQCGSFVKIDPLVTVHFCAPACTPTFDLEVIARSESGLDSGVVVEEGRIHPAGCIRPVSWSVDTEWEEVRTMRMTEWALRFERESTSTVVWPMRLTLF